MGKLEETSTSQHVVLIIDDERAICDSLAGVLSDEGWRPITGSLRHRGYFAVCC